MKYKHIIKVVTILIITFVLIAAFMYYFNQDHECPATTFACANSTRCILKSFVCNNEHDCPEGDDENVYDCTGVRDAPSWDYYVNLFNQNKMNRSIISCLNITEENYASCDYNRTLCSIKCSNFEKREIPKTFTKVLKQLSFKYSSLPVIKKDYFQRYSKLEKMYLNDDEIQNLENNTFISLQILSYLTLSENKIKEVKSGHLTGLKSLETLNLANNKIHTLDLNDLENSKTLFLLDVSRNLLTTQNIYFPFLPTLNELYLDENLLDSITDDLFSRLPGLTTLLVENLDSNLINYISSDAFKNQHQLADLSLMKNKITTIPPKLFVPVRNLSMLAIGYNDVKNLPSITFEPLESSLHSLGIEEININNIDKNIFDMFKNLNTIYFSKFHHCTTYAPRINVCYPASDGVSSLSHLLGRPLLKVAVWGISSVTCLGNALVLWGRFAAKDENHVLSVVIKNLAVSDLLMGIYLLIIGIQDIRFRNNYGQKASGWMHSWSCTFIGVLAMISSEVSVLILSFMSVERFMLIAAPLKGHRAVTPRTAASSMIFIWLAGFVIALFPVIHWQSSTRFYGLNGMCFPLHIDDPFVVGWQYSAFVFLGINLIGLFTISYAYAGMFVSIWKTRHATPLSVGESEFALRFFLIVLTDVICWAPIIVLKIMAIAEYPVPPDLHAWVVVFILPVNSAVNPLLYTFTTTKFREKINDGWLGKIRFIVMRKRSRSGSETSYTCATNKNGTSVMLNSKIIINNDNTSSKQSFNDTMLVNFTGNNSIDGIAGRS